MKNLSEEQAIRKAFNSLSPQAAFSYSGDLASPEDGLYTVAMTYKGSEVDRCVSKNMKDVINWLRRNYPEALWNPFDYGEQNLPLRGLRILRAVERQMIFGKKPKELNTNGK